MNIKKTLFAVLLAAGCLTASAQEEPRTEYVFNPHWYIQAQVGAQHTLGEIDANDLLSPNAQLSLGYQFNKVFGARLAVNAWQSRAGINIKGWSGLGIKEDFPGIKAKWSWNYVAPTVDLTMNLSNAICGYNPERVVNFGIFAGVGANFGFSNGEELDAKNQYENMLQNYNVEAKNQNFRYHWEDSQALLVGKFGCNIDFRLCDAMSAGIELAANVLSDKYNSKDAGNADWYFNALVGIKYNLGKTYTKRVIEPVQPIIQERIVEKIVEKPVEVIKEEPLRRDVFFPINKTDISTIEGQKVREVAEYLSRHPEAKVEIIGYADKDTGTSTINARLADGRSNAVADQLQQQYGISADRITFTSKGDTEQPYNTPELNRVSIIIAK